MAPESEEELAGLIAGAAGPLAVRGGGTRGAEPEGAPLTTARLRGITLYEPEALTLVARAGTPLDEIEAALAANRQRLAFEPADWRGLLGTVGAPTIGGTVAANISGPRRVGAGAARDACLGVRFVDGTGAVIRNGGRVMKNVTGYDLVRLMAGSWGTLGVLSEVALKVMPAPEAEVTLTLPGLEPARAVAAMAAALGSPYAASGAARLPDGRVLIRLEGIAGLVIERAGRMAAHLRDFGAAATVADAASAAMWRGVRDVAPFHGRPGDVWRFSLRPSAAAGVAARLGGEALLDWGGGLVWALVPEGTDARARAQPFAGHASLIRAKAGIRARLPRFQPEAPAVMALAAGLRARFDPRAILNRGLMG
ncbi:MAG: FAD-binding protein [Proteobacteria bacterium]|nr:FAD-binding protein [Pseudomonadota bacterium]MBS0572995.1 FAD-binding protein [Pseudomonadota bacterium]